VDEARLVSVRARINTLARVAGVPVSPAHACSAAASAVGAFGAGLSMTLGAGVREPVFATDSRCTELAELQSTLGQGPCVDAVNGDETVLVADLGSSASGRRWPAFAPAAAALGVRGMFSVPIRAGAARIGVLDLYRDRTGSLTARELSDVLAYADALLELMLDQRGGVGSSLERFLDVEFSERRAGVHQAAGMVSVQLGVGVADALARLRAHAYASDRRLAEVASDVVGRRLWFRTGDGTAVNEPPAVSVELNGVGDPGGTGGVTGVNGESLGDPPDQHDNGGQDTTARPETDQTGEEGVK
jgi:hypothetical protein